jgi:hypothetical protein
MRRGTLLGVTVVCAGGLACAGVGCGSDGSDRDREAALGAIQAAAHKAQRALTAGNMPALCAVMSPRAREQAGRLVHGTPEDCQKDVRAFLATIDEGGGWRGRPPRISDPTVEDDGRRGRVTLSAGEWRAEAPFVESSDGWKLGSFFGSPLADGAELSRAVLQRRRPGASGQVRAAHAPAGFPAAPCAAVFTETFPEISGTCELAISSSDIRPTVLTALGSLSFDRCTMTYRVATDATGRTWVYNVHVDAPPGVANNGCSDILACSDAQGRPVPWKGRLDYRPGGSMLHRFDVCLDTCVGLYDGVVTTRLVRKGRSWTVTADDAPVGASGFRLNGVSTLRANGVRLATTRRP